MRGGICNGSELNLPKGKPNKIVYVFDIHMQHRFRTTEAHVASVSGVHGCDILNG